MFGFFKNIQVKFYLYLVIAIGSVLVLFYTYNMGFNSAENKWKYKLEAYKNSELVVKDRQLAKDLKQLESKLEKAIKAKVEGDKEISNLNTTLLELNNKKLDVEEALRNAVEKNQGNSCNILPPEYYSLYQSILNTQP